MIVLTSALLRPNKRTNLGCVINAAENCANSNAKFVVPRKLCSQRKASCHHRLCDLEVFNNFLLQELNGVGAYEKD